MSSPVSRPQPNLADPLIKTFYDAVREHRLVFQNCSSCGYIRWPVARSCPECFSFDYEWLEHPGTGTLWSACTYVRALHPGFVDEVPYSVGGVQLDDGPFMLGRLASPVEGDPVGRVVTAQYLDVGPDETRLVFG